MPEYEPIKEKKLSTALNFSKYDKLDLVKMLEVDQRGDPLLDRRKKKMLRGHNTRS